MNRVGFALVLAGLFCGAGGLFGWGWFMDTREAWLIVKIFGRSGARVFYVLIGMALVVFGVLRVIGVI